MDTTMNATAIIQKRDRYAWVDFAKGLCIVAVVALWLSKEMQGYVMRGQAGWLGYFVVFAKPFRMPDFFLISGLFLSRVIDRPIKHYLDTKVIHYLYFFVLWTVIAVTGSWLLGRDTPVSLLAGVQALLYQLYDPFANLWFIMMLPMYFVAARLLRNFPVWLVLPVAAALMIFPVNTGIYHVDRFGVFFIYFYAGHALSSKFFSLADWAQEHRTISIAGVIAWIGANAYLIKQGWAEEQSTSLFLGFLGISALVVISSLVSKLKFASWLNYLGKNSIVVYLGFYLPMIVIVPALQASSLGPRINLVGTIALIACIAIPVSFYHLANRIGLSFLYRRPDWAKLVKPNKSLSGDLGQRKLNAV